MSLERQLDLAWDLFRDGHKVEAMTIASDLVSDGHSPALMLLGLLHEYGGSGIDPDLERAVSVYRKFAYSMPSDVAHLYLARACLKVGGRKHIELAGESLMEARRFGCSGALYLALAAWHERRGEWGAAARNNLFAACYGRILGMTRASVALWNSGAYVSAASLRVLQVFLGPIVWLLRGRRALDDF